MTLLWNLKLESEFTILYQQVWIGNSLFTCFSLCCSLFTNFLLEQIPEIKLVDKIEFDLGIKLVKRRREISKISIISYLFNFLLFWVTQKNLWTDLTDRIKSRVSLPTVKLVTKINKFIKFNETTDV